MRDSESLAHATVDMNRVRLYIVVGQGEDAPHVGELTTGKGSARGLPPLW